MSPWQLEEDGRLHKYSLLVAVVGPSPVRWVARARRLTLLHRHICSAHRIRPSFFAMLSSSGYVCTRSDRPDPRSRLCPLSRPLLRSPAAMPLFNGGAPPAQGENVDSCYLYKNGGVGMLGQMGDASVVVPRALGVGGCHAFVDERRTHICQRPPLHQGQRNRNSAQGR